MTGPRHATMPVFVDTFMNRFGPLPADFFQNVPEDSQAIFSTKGGKMKRRLFNGHRMSPQIARTHDESTMMEKICCLRRDMPDACDEVKPPQSIHDLHHYFDPVDLWSFTAGFLGDLLEEMARQNDKKKAIITTEFKEWLNFPEIQQQIISIPLGKMDQLLTPENREYLGYDKLGQSEQNIVLETLNQHRKHLEPQFQQDFQAQRAELERVKQVATQRRVSSHGVVQPEIAMVQDVYRTEGGRASSLQSLPNVQLIQSASAPCSAPCSTCFGVLQISPVAVTTSIQQLQPTFLTPNLTAGGLLELQNDTIRHINNPLRPQVSGSARSWNEGKDNRNITNLQNNFYQRSRPRIQQEQRIEPIYVHESQQKPPGYRGTGRYNETMENHMHQRSTSNSHLSQFQRWTFGESLPMNELYRHPRVKTSHPGSWRLAEMSHQDSHAHQAFVRQLPNNAIYTDDLMIAMSQCGTVVSINYGFDRETGEFSGRAWVGFEKEEQVDCAVQRFGGTYFQGKTLNVTKNTRPFSSRLNSLDAEPSTEPKAGQQPDVLRLSVLPANESQDVRNHLYGTESRIYRNTRSNSTLNASSTNQTYMTTQHERHQKSNVARIHSGELGIKQFRSSHILPDRYITTQPHISNPLAEQRTRTMTNQPPKVRGERINIRYDQNTTVSQPKLYGTNENTNPYEHLAERGPNEYVMGKKERLLLDQSKFETPTKKPGRRRIVAPSSGGSTWSPSNQNLDSVSQHNPVTPTKNKKRKTPPKMQDLGASIPAPVPRTKSTHTSEMAKPPVTSAKAASAVSTSDLEKEKSVTNEAPALHQISVGLSDTALSECRRKAAEVPEVDASKTNRSDTIIEPSKSPSLPGTMSVSEFNTALATLTVSTCGTTFTGSHLTPKSPKGTGTDSLDFEHIRNRLNSLGRKDGSFATSGDMVQRQSHGHRDGSVRSQKNRSSLTKKSSSLSPTKVGKRYANLENSKSKKLFTNKQLDKQQHADQAPPILPLDDEKQFPTLGCCKKSATATRVRGASFVTVLNSGKKSDELELPVLESLPQPDSNFTSLSALSSANNEPKAKKLTLTHNEAWPEAHFGHP